MGNPRYDAVVAKEVREDNLVPEHHMDYQEWLDWTGKDDSFVGNGINVPGTADLYAEAMRQFVEIGPGEPAPEPAPGPRF